MKYEIIFTLGYTDDSDSLARDIKCDVLILDEIGNYYCPQFITITRIHSRFHAGERCYLEDNLVILHEVTKETILSSIQDLHRWKFQLRWYPLTTAQLEKYFYPKETWVYFSVNVDDNK